MPGGRGKGGGGEPLRLALGPLDGSNLVGADGDVSVHGDAQPVGTDREEGIVRLGYLKRGAGDKGRNAGEFPAAQEVPFDSPLLLEERQLVNVVDLEDLRRIG